MRADQCKQSLCSLTGSATEELESVLMEIAGITSGDCAKAIKTALIKLPGVKGVDINWKKGTADIKVKRGSGHEAIVEAVGNEGFIVTSIK